MADAEVRVSDNPEQHRYEVFVDGDLAGSSAYRDEDGRRVFTHTTVDPDYEGEGIGSTLARQALEDTRAHGLAVVPRCQFIAGYIRRHPEFADLVASN